MNIRYIFKQNDNLCAPAKFWESIDSTVSEIEVLRSIKKTGVYATQNHYGKFEVRKEEYI